jgi:hypothetical protein
VHFLGVDTISITECIIRFKSSPSEVLGEFVTADHLLANRFVNITLTNNDDLIAEVQKTTVLLLLSLKVT